MEKQELLNCAADYIDKHGKTEGQYFRGRRGEDCAACAVGAMLKCLPDVADLLPLPEYHLADGEQKIRDVMPGVSLGAIFMYSDTHSKDQVVAWLRNGMKE